MAAVSPPFALQNASHPASLFRIAAASAFSAPGMLTVDDLYVTAAPTPNLTVTVAAGRLWIAGTEGAKTATPSQWSTQGWYLGINDAPLSVSIASADPTNPRIDVVYAMVNDSAFSGTVDNLTIGVATGTPAVSPQVPALPKNAAGLATVAVAAGATAVTQANLGNLVTAAVTRGGLVNCTYGNYPSGLPLGAQLLETDTGDLRSWDGLYWLYSGHLGDPTQPVTAAQHAPQWTAYIPSGNAVSAASGGTPATLTGYSVTRNDLKVISAVNGGSLTIAERGLYTITAVVYSDSTAAGRSDVTLLTPSGSATWQAGQVYDRRQRASGYPASGTLAQIVSTGPIYCEKNSTFSVQVASWSAAGIAVSYQADLVVTKLPAR